MTGAVRRGGRGAAAALALALAAAAPARAADDLAPSRSADDFVLSRPADNLWRWATVGRAATARSAPAAGAPVVARLRRETPEHTPEAVPLLARRVVGGRLWVRVRLPVLPNGTTGWVRRSALGGYETVRTHLVIDRHARTAILRRRGRAVFRARVGIGKRGTPTPRGEFLVRNRLTGFTDPLYGALAFGTTARSATLTDWPGGGFIGIHGTNAPQLIPGRISHGCIRLRNRAIRRLDRRMPVGTPVTIR